MFSYNKATRGGGCGRGMRPLPRKAQKLRELLKIGPLYTCKKTLLATVGVKLKFPFGFRCTEPKRYAILTKNSYKTDKQLQCLQLHDIYFSITGVLFQYFYPYFSNSPL